MAVAAAFLAGVAISPVAMAADRPAAAAQNDRAHLDALIARAEAGDPTGDPKGYYANFVAALAEAKRIYPPDHPEIAAREAGVATGLAALNRFAESQPMLEAAIARLAKAGPEYRQPYLDALDTLGYVRNYRGDHDGAIAVLKQAIDVYRKIGSPSAAYAFAISNLAAVSWEGGYRDNSLELNAEAIAMARRLDPIPGDVVVWYANRVQYLRGAGRVADAIATGREGLQLGQKLLPANHPLLANLYANLATMLTQQGRPSAAFPLAKRAYESIEAANGGPNQNSATIRAIAANALTESGRDADAVAFLDDALPVLEAQLGPFGNRTLQARKIRAMALMRLGRFDEAIVEERAVIAGFDTHLPPTHVDRMDSRVVLARIALAKGDPETAVAAMREDIALRSAVVPPSHPDLLAERALQLLARSRAGAAAAVDLAPEAREVLGLLVTNANLDLTAPVLQDTSAAFGMLAEVLLRAGDRDSAWIAQQWSARTSVDDAAAIAAAERSAAAKPAEAASIEQRRKLLAERNAMFAAIDGQLRKPVEGFDLAGSNARLAELDGKLRNYDAELAAAGVTTWRFRPVSIDAVRGLLGRHDLFMAFSAVAGRYIVTSVTRDGARQYLASQNAAVIRADVEAVRATLDPRQPDHPFDRARALALSNALFEGQAAAMLKGVTRLLVSANGALGALPFGVLPDPARSSGFLVDRLSVERLPGAPHGGGTQAPLAPDLFAMGDVKPGDGPTGTLRGGAELPGDLPPLPGAHGELTDLARAIGDADPVILTGSAATEAALRDAQVKPGGVLAFATHGLLSGEVEGLREPALVLYPEGKDDGLLTASEIARLDLPARWVVLSACNTAAGAGPDAPGLSGLAQSFMLAGAGNIIATHWPVRDDMARAISTGTLAAAAKGAAPAEALRRAILAARKSVKGGDVPALWGAFELVGN